MSQRRTTRRWAGGLTLSLLLLLSMTVLGSPPASGSPQSALKLLPRHYSTGESVEIRSVGHNECRVAASQRSGAWACPGSTAKRRAAVQAKQQRGTCSALGCWDYVSTAKAEFHGDGIYGYGKRTLGYTTFFITLTWSGGNSKSKPFRFESTRGVRNLKMSGERIYFSSRYQQGHPCCGGDTYQVYRAGNVSANTAEDAFPPNGYAHYAAPVAYGGVAHQYSWEDAEFDGTWWTYVNSPKFRRNSSGAYIGSNPPAMGTEWYGSGYDG
jgi:hypothetical protein